MSNAPELDYARELTDSALVAPPHYIDVITVACAATYKIDYLFTAPRIIALGLKGSGKSTVLKVANYLANGTTGPTGVLAMTAPSYVADYRMNPHWTPLLDEVNHLFGEAGSNGKNSKFYTYLNQGYSRETAFAQHQENKVPLRIPIFGIVFMAGLGLGCPPDTRERGIILRMEKAAGKQQVADFAQKETRDAFAYGGRMLKSWAQRIGPVDTAAVRGLHEALTHRCLEVWGPLFTITLAADGGVKGEWTERLLVAFERLELDAGVPVYAPEDQILMDYLAFIAATGADEGVPSGAFAAFANEMDHGAYLHLKPGQFKQFAVAVLGPTAPFYDNDQKATVRGWSDQVNRMNISAALARKADLEAAKEPDTDESTTWEDF